jgi:NAD(P)H-dependent FMN reductase
MRVYYWLYIMGRSRWRVSVRSGATGGFGANHHLRQSLVSPDMPTLQQPAPAGPAGCNAPRHTPEDGPRRH